MVEKKIYISSRYPAVSGMLAALLTGMDWVVVDRASQKDLTTLRLIDISDNQDVDVLESQISTGAPVVIYSRLPETKLLSILFEYEIKGVVHFSSQMESIGETLAAAQNGEVYFDERMLTFILSDKYREIHERIASLSKRELEIIDGILEDLTNDEIAERFDLSVRTVNAHKRNILQKMNERSLVGVVKTILLYSLRFR